MTRTAVSPMLPPGRFIDLPGRGRTFYREVSGPPGAPVALLLHGWTASADLNFHALFEPLGHAWRVIAPDHRSHGRGIRHEERFTLEDAADDAAALLRALEIEHAVIVGYSMGGAVAQLVWKRHRAVVDALVLCATASTFSETWKDTAVFGLLGGLTVAGRRLPVAVQRRIGRRLVSTRRRDLAAWVASELERHDWPRVSEAGVALGRFNSDDWLHAVDVPVASIITLSDDVVDPMRQLRLARAIPGTEMHMIEGNHAVCATEPERFARVLGDACAQVARRAQGHTSIRPLLAVPTDDGVGFTVWRMQRNSTLGPQAELTGA